jgi:DNA-binding MarR family transcriptional regulator
MDAQPPKPTARRAPRVNRRWQAADELIDEVTRAAERIATARTWHDELVFRTTGPWRVLTTVARSQYCLSISDLARALGVRKQTAHALAHQAARAEYVELVPNHQDRRLLQALVTPRGRAELAARRSAERAWLVLLNGLGDHEMATVIHVLRVIRQRLERDARERERRERQLRRPRPWPPGLDFR